MGKKRINLDLDLEKHKAFKIYCINNNFDMATFLKGKIDEVLKNE